MEVCDFSADTEPDDPLRMMLVKSETLETPPVSWFPPTETVDSSVYTEEDAYAALQLAGDGQVRPWLCPPYPGAQKLRCPWYPVPPVRWFPSTENRGVLEGALVSQISQFHRTNIPVSQIQYPIFKGPIFDPRRLSNETNIPDSS